MTPCLVDWPGFDVLGPCLERARVLSGALALWCLSWVLRLLLPWLVLPLPLLLWRVLAAGALLSSLSTGLLRCFALCSTGALVLPLLLPLLRLGASCSTTLLLVGLGALRLSV